jgi:hypothetical protein
MRVLIGRLLVRLGLKKLTPKKWTCRHRYVRARYVENKVFIECVECWTKLKETEHV